MNDKTASSRRPITAQLHYDSPLGKVLLVRTERGLAGAWFENQRHHPLPFDAPERKDDPLLCRAARQLEAYFNGADAAFDVPLDLQGTPFQRAVWGELLKLGHGTTCTYGDIAGRIGRPTAGRAVGAAVGRNPISVIVPCHRVVGGDGSLTGYAGGLDRKTALLRGETRNAEATSGRTAPLEMH